MLRQIALFVSITHLCGEGKLLSFDICFSGKISCVSQPGSTILSFFHQAYFGTSDPWAGSSFFSCASLSTKSVLAVLRTAGFPFDLRNLINFAQQLLTCSVHSPGPSGTNNSCPVTLIACSNPALKFHAHFGVIRAPWQWTFNPSQLTRGS